MSVIRPQQRALTAVLPHAGNKRYAIPKRIFNSELPSLRPVYVFDGIVGGSMIVTDVDDSPLPGAWECQVISLDFNGTQFPIASHHNTDSLGVDTSLRRLIGKRGGDLDNTPTDSVAEGTVHKIGLSWDGDFEVSTTVSLWLDGVVVTTFPCGTTDTLRTIKIGCENPWTSGFFGGVIANVKIWQGTDDMTKPPEYFWKIDEGSGTDIKNYGSEGSAGDQTLVTGSGYWASYPSLESL